MLDVIKFILNCIIELGKMLFTIDLGSGLNLGLLMCILFIFLPMLLRIVYFLRNDVVEEINTRYDETRPREYFDSHEHNVYNPSTGKFTTTHHQNEGVRATNRYRGKYRARRSVLK